MLRSAVLVLSLLFSQFAYGQANEWRDFVRLVLDLKKTASQPERPSTEALIDFQDRIGEFLSDPRRAIEILDYGTVKPGEENDEFAGSLRELDLIVSGIRNGEAFSPEQVGEYLQRIGYFQLREAIEIAGRSSTLAARSDMLKRMLSLPDLIKDEVLGIRQKSERIDSAARYLNAALSGLVSGTLGYYFSDQSFFHPKSLVSFGASLLSWGKYNGWMARTGWPRIREAYLKKVLKARFTELTAAMKDAISTHPEWAVPYVGALAKGEDKAIRILALQDAAIEALLQSDDRRVAAVPMEIALDLVKLDEISRAQDIFQKIVSRRDTSDSELKKLVSGAVQSKIELERALGVLRSETLRGGDRGYYARVKRAGARAIDAAKILTINSWMYFFGTQRSVASRYVRGISADPAEIERRQGELTAAFRDLLDHAPDKTTAELVAKLVARIGFSGAMRDEVRAAAVNAIMQTTNPQAYKEATSITANLTFARDSKFDEEIKKLMDWGRTACSRIAERGW